MLPFSSVNFQEYWLFTLDICTPRFLCTPEHSMHRRTPRFRDAQSGSAAPQSAQISLPATFLSNSIGLSGLMLVRWCCVTLEECSKYPLPGFLSIIQSSLMEWSSSVELLKELLSLFVRWWPLPLGLSSSRWSKILMEQNINVKKIKSGYINNYTVVIKH